MPCACASALAKADESLEPSAEPTVLAAAEEEPVVCACASALAVAVELPEASAEALALAIAEAWNSRRPPKSAQS